MKEGKTPPTPPHQPECSKEGTVDFNLFFLQVIVAPGCRKHSACAQEHVLRALKSRIGRFCSLTGGRRFRRGSCQAAASSPRPPSASAPAPAPSPRKASLNRPLPSRQNSKRGAFPLRPRPFPCGTLGDVVPPCSVCRDP